MNRRDGVGGDKRTQHMGGERRREAGGGGGFRGVQSGRVGDTQEERRITRTRFVQKCYNDVDYLVC